MKRLISMLLAALMLLSVCSMTGCSSGSFATVRYTVLVLDGSGSMDGNAIVQQAKAASKFCEDLSKSYGTNYVALVKLGSGSTLISDFTTDMDTIIAGIEKIKANEGTDYGAALATAGTLLSEVTAKGNVVKNIVFLSDGFPAEGDASSDGPYTSSFYCDYEYANYAYNYAEILKEDYTIYTLGFFHNLSASDREIGAKILSDLASDPEKYYEVTDPEELEVTFVNVAGDITRTSLSDFLYTVLIRVVIALGLTAEVIQNMLF